MTKILFNQDSSAEYLSKGELLRYSAIKTGMDIVFEDRENGLLSGTIIQLFTDKDDESELEVIIGCLIDGSDGQKYECRIDEDDKMWALLDPMTLSSEPGIDKEEKLIERKPAPNLFQGRIEAEKGPSKFPDWDITPPNQFINPRIKNL